MEREYSHDPEEQSVPIRRLVGPLEIEEETIMKNVREKFQHPEKLPFEREKTEKENRIINEILPRLSDFLKQYGIESVELTSDHIHIVDKGDLTSEENNIYGVPEGVGGYYMEDKQGVVLFSHENELRFVERLVHEALHANSFTSFAWTEKGYKLRRSGFVIENDEEERYFHDLNEGLTEELTKRFDKEYSDKIASISVAVTRRKEFIDSIKTDNPKAGVDEICSVVTEQKSDGVWKTIVAEYVYEKERSELARLVQDLYEKNSDKFNSPEEVFRMFVQAAFTGRLLEIARLIESSLGKGSFRKIAEITKWEEKLK